MSSFEQIQPGEMGPFKYIRKTFGTHYVTNKSESGWRS
jgi:hypothetical protein